MRHIIFIFIVFYCLSAQTDSSEKKNSVSKSESVQVEVKQPAPVVSDNQTDTVTPTVNKTIEAKEKAEDTTQKEAVSLTSPPSTDQQEEKGLKSFSNTLASVDTSIELGLEYPLSFGAHGKFHVSESIYTRLGAGFASELLVTSFSKIAPSLGYLNRQEANLISDVIQNSFFGALRFGWMPYTKKFGGPYMELGLLYLIFGRGETSGTVLNAAIETDLSQAGSNKYSVRSDLLNGTFHVGYQIPIEKNVHLNLELGVLKILYVNMKKNNPKGSEIVSLPKEHHKNFEQFLLNKGWIFPTLSAWLGFSF